MIRQLVVLPSTITPPPPSGGGSVIEFEFLPAADLEVDPEEELAALVADEDDFIEIPQDAPLPFGKSWGFDFGQGRFNRYGTGPVETTGLHTLRHWIEKALSTERFAHTVYSDDFGIENLTDVIGSQHSPEVWADIESRIRDTLSIHDRITNIEDFEVVHDPMQEYVEVNFTVVTDTEELLEFESMTLGG